MDTTTVDAPTGTKEGERIDFASAGPGTVGGRYLRKFWQPVYLSRDLAPGTARPIHVMGERFTLYRGQAGKDGPGTAHIVGFRCARDGR